MPFITTVKEPKVYQVTFDDLLNGVDTLRFELQGKDTHDTRTVYRKTTPPRLLEIVDIQSMVNELETFNRKYEKLIAVEDKSTLYLRDKYKNCSFYIPKRSGGLRPIDAPSDELMQALNDLLYIMQKKLYFTYHTSAFAYVTGRSPLNALQRHQANKSKWFLKLDFHDFFGSTTPDFVMKMLALTFPCCEIMATERGRKALQQALSLCFLREGLPQGAPTSPALTNQIMIPIDHAIAKYAREHSPHLCYTRYADDIQLSSDLSFESGYISKVMNLGETLKAIKSLQREASQKITEVKNDGHFYCYTVDELKTANVARFIALKGQHCTTRQITVTGRSKWRYMAEIEELLKVAMDKTSVLKDIVEILHKAGAPFTLSVGKTRYGSTSGRNWNLGLMLTKDNTITVGSQKKKTFKAMLCSFACDYKRNNGNSTWSLNEVQVLNGLRSYYCSAEKEYIDEMVQKMSKKFKVDIDKAITNILKCKA